MKWSRDGGEQTQLALKESFISGEQAGGFQKGAWIAYLNPARIGIKLIENVLRETWGDSIQGKHNEIKQPGAIFIFKSNQ